MEKTLASLLFFLSLIILAQVMSYALAYMAQKRSFATLVHNSETNSAYCAYAYDEASLLGIFSSISLACAQTIVMVETSCFFGRNLSPGCSKAWAFAFFIASWVPFFAAEGILLTASATGAFPFDYMSMLGYMPDCCEDMRKQMFKDGAICVVFTSITSELFLMGYGILDSPTKRLVTMSYT